MKQKKTKGMDRRTFIKTSGMIGLGAATSTFGVPKLLRAAPPTIKIGSVQPATGPLSVIGVGQRRGNQLAVEVAVHFVGVGQAPGTHGQSHLVPAFPLRV